MTGFHVDVTPIDESGFMTQESAWRELERLARDRASPYLSFDWLSAWLEIYAPDRVAVIRVTSDQGIAALGLVDQGRGGHWRFAGHSVTPLRALLCADDDASVWSAFASWLVANRKQWKTLDVEGAPSVVEALPRATLEDDPVPVLDLPESFDAYFEELPGKTRRRHRGRLRDFGLARGEVVQASEVGPAVRELIQLHNRRAKAKGESHPQMNEQLARMLELASRKESLHLVVTRLEVDGDALALAVHIDYGRATYSYNTAMHPSGASFSPGVLLELDAVRLAIDRGSRRFEFGPGLYYYKKELGGVPEPRYSVHATAPTLAGAGAAVREKARRLLRSSGVLRRLRGRIRR